jgi:protein TonB
MIYTRFVLPATVAVSAHVLLLFGFRWNHSIVSPDHDSQGTKVEWLVVPIPPDEDPLPPDLTKTADRPRGDTDLRPPIGDEPPPNPTGDILLPPPAARVSGPVAPKITGIFGDPNSPEDYRPRTNVVDAASLDREPRTRSQVSPVYPDSAKSLGRVGEVFVEFMVDETGHVVRPRVIRSSDPMFEEPTLRAVERWRFEPGKKNGRVVRFRMAVPVKFNLES